MPIRSSFRNGVAALYLAVLWAFLATAPEAGAAEPSADIVEIDIASVFPISMPVLGHGAQSLSQQAARMSGGTLILRIHEPGTLVEGREAATAVADGRVAAAWAGAGWLADRDSAFDLFSSIPFGTDIPEYLAWFYYGGGLELARDIFADHGIHNIPCGIIPPEASGWFAKEIRSPQDLDGLRMRFFGLGARVMERFGAITVMLAPDQIGPALDAGEIDAAEFSLPAMDRSLGLQDKLPYYYFPGWHQQATLFDLHVALPVWNGLSDSHQAIVEAACGNVIRDMIAEGEAIQWRALQDMQHSGVQLRRWPAEMLVAFEDAWLDIVAQESARNPNFARVYASFMEFRSNYQIWRHFSFLR